MAGTSDLKPARSLSVNFGGVIATILRNDYDRAIVAARSTARGGESHEDPMDTCGNGAHLLP